MRTVGQFLKAARVQKKLSLSSLEEQTKIKKVFLEAIEKCKWDSLPEYPVVLGFVRNVSLYLGEDPEKTSALLRRDYPPRDLSVNPKPDVSRKFVWSPKLTFIAGVGLTVAVFLGYLSLQYIRFVSPPRLIVNSPLENQEVTQKKIIVSGKTDTDAVVVINNQPIILDNDGNFSVEIEVAEKTEEIIVDAKARSGKETVVKRKITVNLK